MLNEGSYKIEGDFRISSKYALNSKGVMICGVADHTLLPRDAMPTSVSEFLMSLQRSIPFELFDPSDCGIQTTVKAFQLL
jgi:hypothetical protein